jgi:hypothetical protein
VLRPSDLLFSPIGGYKFCFIGGVMMKNHRGTAGHQQGGNFGKNTLEHLAHIERGIEDAVNAL